MRSNDPDLFKDRKLNNVNFYPQSRLSLSLSLSLSSSDDFPPPLSPSSSSSPSSFDLSRHFVLIMAKKGKFPGAFAPNYESEGSGSSGRFDTDVAMSHGSNVPIRKCVSINPAACDKFGILKQLLPVSEMSSYERKELVLRLKSELEQIRNFQKIVSTKKRTNIGALSSSSDILSCSNLPNVPIVEKKISTSENNKAKGLNRGNIGKFESSSQPTVPSTSEIMLMKQCETLLKKLMEHQFGWVFNTPVDVVKLNIPDYFTVIKNPMDLGTVKKKMGSNVYGPRDFAADVRLTFSNAMIYNPRGNDVHIMADTLSKFFEVRWRVIEKKLQKDTQPSKEKSSVNVEKEIVKPIMPSKKRKIASTQPKVNPEIVIRKMSDEEKIKLSSDLEAVLGDLPDAIVDFLREQSSNAKETREDEIEIDINDLSNDALFKLRKLLDDFLQMRLKNHSKAEHCEIELQNEPGLSNSSTELQKGDDGNMDIGGNEPPVSSFPLVEVEKLADSGFSVCKVDGAEASNPARSPKGKSVPEVVLDEKIDATDMLDDNQCVSGLDQSEQVLQKQDSVISDGYRDEESAPEESQVLPDKLYRAALLKNRFLDTILKAREKTISQGEKGDPEKLRREKEALEMQKRREKARLQAEAKAAEDARKRAEAEAAAEVKKKREMEREAARQALLKMEKTVEINENSRFLEDLEMLSAAPIPEQLPSSVDESSPEHSLDGLGSFKFSGNNPLEQLGLYMKLDEEDEEGEPPRLVIPNITDDVEEGEID